MSETTFLKKIRLGLSKSRQKLTGGLADVLTKRKLDEEGLAALEEVLLSADLGPKAAARIIENFRKTRFGKEVTEEEIKKALAQEMAAILRPVAVPLEINPDKKPFVVLMVGVNGTGKTTTLGKLAARWQKEGKKVMLVAGDTFRAAAVEQLQVWGQRAGVPVKSAVTGADAASLAFDALQQAVAEGTDILAIDTAGRLHNKKALMDELGKVLRVLKKIDPTAPHAVLLVLDATTGQNALEQVRVFREMTDVSGLIITKLDGSARGGITVALAQNTGLPVHAVGVGEQVGDLDLFDPEDFAENLVGLRKAE